MPRLPIEFNNSKFTVDIPGYIGGIQTGSFVRDLYIDANGNHVFRPVFENLYDGEADASMKGIYWWDEAELWVAVVNTGLYTGNSLASLSALTSGASFVAGNYTLASFANYGNALYIANGGTINKVTTGPVAMTALGGSAPTDVSSLVVKDKYLLAVSDANGWIYFSDVGDPDTFSGDYFEAESEPDPVYHIAKTDDYIYLFGKKTGEVWYNDGVSPWAKLTQGFFSGGTRSKYCVAWSDYLNTFIWVTDDFRVVKLEGRQPVSLSHTLDQYLGFYRQWADPGGELSDTYGRRFAGHCILWDGIPFYILTHHTLISAEYDYIGMCVAVNLLNGEWSEWTENYFDSPDTLYIPFQASCLTNGPDGYIIAGDASRRMVHRLVRDDHDECYLGEISPKLRSVFHDRGDASVWKYCNSITIEFKAPYTHTDSLFSVSVSYSDNGGASWTSNRVVSCTVPAGTKQYSVESYNWGRYKERQWLINIGASGGVISIGKVIEDFDYVH